MSPIELVLSKLADANKSGKGWSARCPAHDDRRASLSIGEGEDTRALVKCHAGCKVEAICAAVDLRVADLMPVADARPVTCNLAGRGKSTGKGKIVAEYDYRDESSNIVFQVVRLEPKDFRQRLPDGKGGWTWSVKGARVLPYRVPELLARPEYAVVVVEGEKDVDNLAHLGLLATCNAGGAGKWTNEHAKHLAGRFVVILADNDEPGRKHASQVAMSLHGLAAGIRIVELPGLPPKGDVSDWIAAGGKKEDLIRLIDSTPDWAPVAANSDPWPDIESFDELDLPNFPTHALPNALRKWVEAESHATQTPPDLAALLALAVCSATIARRVEVEPRLGWREPVNLFVAVLLEPGNRKSAVFKDALRPLREIEDELAEEKLPSIARQKSERRQSECRLRKLEENAAKKDDLEAREEACKLAAELAQSIEPELPRLIVDDATSEKLGIILAQQDGRIASMSPEGGVFDLMAGLYSRSGMPQFGVYLMGHSGDDHIVDRVSRPSIRIERTALTCAYAMQPQVIEGLAENSAFRGRGLLARFLYAAPRSWIGERAIAPEPVSEQTRESYRQTIRAMANREGGSVLHLSDEAGEVLKTWEEEIESMLGDGAEMEMFKDWGSKLAGATLRIAGVMHCVEFDLETCISSSTMRASIEIARYLIPHAQAVLQMMQAEEDSANADAQYILRWIKRHQRREFTKRDAQQHGKRRFRNANDIEAPLAALVMRGYIRLRPVAAPANGPGRPASPMYEVNPAVFSNEISDIRSHNSHNAEQIRLSCNSENIESALEPTDNADRMQVTI
jgi:hypothetical protein